jgi:hypothetical protein
MTKDFLRSEVCGMLGIEYPFFFGRHGRGSGNAESRQIMHGDVR